MQEIIYTDNLSKNYKDVHAARNINLKIKKGEIYGFLGLNGAGKTTTIRMLLGMINPTSGFVKIKGTAVNRKNNKLWENIGYMVETPHAYPALTVKENLQLLAKLRKVDANKSINEIIEKLDLVKYSNRKFKNLSLGNKQRVGLAKALFHKPEILILDEPTNGLDPAGIHDIRSMLIDLAHNHGVTILISSHILGEVSRFATRIGIINNGRIIQELNTAELETLCSKKLIIQTNNNHRCIDLLQNSGYKEIEIEDNKIELKDINALKAPHKVAQLIVSQQIELHQLQVEDENLESFFLRTIKGKENQL